MFTNDTIAAISTPTGRGGIGIVRLSGKEAVNIADKIFRPAGNKSIADTPSHRILYGHVMAPSRSEIIDEVLVSVMKAPRTYTREDIVEINCHGGPVSLRRVLELLLQTGARLASPGEFTQRAFLNGRIDLAQAEAVLDIINSLTVQSQKTSIDQLKGTLSGRLSEIREQLIELTVFVEAYIDFPEEDIEALSQNDMEKRAQGILRDLRKMVDSSRYGLILREGLNTAITGRPNVGKSSLLNALLEHDRAIVTEIPGTTRDVIEEYLNIEGLPVKIMDTAGIRDVEDIAEREGVKRSVRAMEEADLVLIVLDGSEALHEADRELIAKSSPAKTIIVVNKCDLPSAAMETDALPAGHIIHISAKTGKGLDALKKAILDTAIDGRTDFETGMITNTRHVHALEKAAASMHAFLEGTAAHVPPELLSVELRDALDAIGEILGTTTPEDILNKIFSDFCIGK